MNYTEIKEKFPKAFEALSQWCFMVEYPSPENLDTGDLYDFFSDQSIIVQTEPEFDYTTSDGTYAGLVVLENKPPLYVGMDFSTRIEAETAAFIEAFEILEERLKQ